MLKAFTRVEATEKVPYDITAFDAWSESLLVRLYHTVLLPAVLCIYGCIRPFASPPDAVI